MTVESHVADSARVIIRARVLQDQAKRLRERAGLACEHSGEIREVLLLNDPLKRSNSAYRVCSRLMDVLDRILDTGIMVEPWRRATPKGIDLSKGRLTTVLIQTHLLNEEIIVNRRKRLRLSSCARQKLGILQPANFLDRLDRIFDKGIVIDSWQHIHVSGIDMLGVEVRSVLVSTETHFLDENQYVSPEALKVKAAASPM